MRKKNYLFIFVSLAIFSTAACSGGGGETPTGIVAAPTALSESDVCSSFIDNISTGLSCLHCTQPEARDQARMIADLMVRSCLKRIATNFLVDDTFQHDGDFLLELMDTLTQGGRELFVTFFLSNGPAQRNFATTQITGFGVKKSPADFRVLVQSDEETRSQYRALVTRIQPVIARAQSRGARVAVIPMLEDNLDNAGFAAMVELTNEVLGTGAVVIGRNPCFEQCFPNCNEGCTEGSELDFPAGVIPEVHTVGPSIVTGSGIISNDGLEYESPATGQIEGSVTTLRDMQNVRLLAHTLGNAFILWSGGRQGLFGKIHEIAFLPPASRTYLMPDAEEQEELIRFLRLEDF